MPITFERPTIFEKSLDATARLGADLAQQYLTLQNRSNMGSEPLSTLDQMELERFQHRPENMALKTAQEKYDQLNQFPRSLFTSQKIKNAALQEIRNAQAYEFGYSLKLNNPELPMSALKERTKAYAAKVYDDKLYVDIEKNLRNRMIKAEKNTKSFAMRFFSSTETQENAMKEFKEASAVYQAFQDNQKPATTPSISPPPTQAEINTPVKKPPAITHGLENHLQAQKTYLPSEPQNPEPSGPEHTTTKLR